MERARFHLVLLQEYFTSRRAFKDLLCWELEDVLYFKPNARRGRPCRASGELYPAPRPGTRLDARHRHFNASFWRKVEAFGRERMAREAPLCGALNELAPASASTAACCGRGGHPGLGHAALAAAGRQVHPGLQPQEEHRAAACAAVPAHAHAGRSSI